MNEKDVKELLYSLKAAGETFEPKHGFIQRAQYDGKQKINSKKKFISYEAAYGKAFHDMARRVPNLSRIEEMTGYTPETTLEQTLEIIIDYFREIDG